MPRKLVLFLLSKLLEIPQLKMSSHLPQHLFWGRAKDFLPRRSFFSPPPALLFQMTQNQRKMPGAKAKHSRRYHSNDQALFTAKKPKRSSERQSDLL